MQNIVSFVKKRPGSQDESYHFKYEVGSDEPLVVESLVDLLSRGQLNCFDVALIRRDMEKAQEIYNAYEQSNSQKRAA